MKRMLAMLLSAMLLLAAAPFAHAEEEAVLNIFTWETYFDYDTVIKPFTEATGIKVNYANFNSNEEMLAKLQAVKGGDYDIVLASDYILDIARNEGLLQEIDKSKIATYENIDPDFQSQYYDPENKYTIPYTAGNPLIVYDPAYVDFEIKGYNDLWNPALKDSITAMNDMRVLIGFTLKSMGKSLNETDPEVLKQAQEKLLELAPNIRALDYDTPHQLLISGEATVGLVFTPQVAWALYERPDLAVAYPEEGLGFGIDNIVIPVNAPHPDNAHKFIEFILQPEIGAAIAEVQWYMNCNKAAAGLVEEYWEREDLNYIKEYIYIPDTFIKNPEFIEDVGDALTLYNEIWTVFKQELGQ